MRINEIEEEQLRAYYETANESDTDESWADVRAYYNQLGKKYGFDPKRVMINTKGEVTRMSANTIYVVSNVEIGVPTAAFYSKEKAINMAKSSNSLNWDEIELQ